MINYIGDIFPMLRFIATCSTVLVFLFPVSHRKYIVIRYLAVILLYLVLGLIASYFQTDIIMGRILVYSCTLCAVIFCADINWKEVLYHGIWAVIVSDLFMTTYALINMSLDPRLSLPGWVEIALILAYIAGYNVIIGLTVAKSLLLNHSYHIGPRQFFSSLLLVVIFEVLNYFLLDTLLVNNNLIFAAFTVIGQLYCAMVLYLQNALFSKSEVQQDLDRLYYLWVHQKNQYQISKENINLINQKCHDLRHQLAAIRTSRRSTDFETYQKEIENSINIYDSIVRTGNEALDTILTEKSLYCTARSIDIHCVADGEALSFIGPVDIYSIFGNAVDNAIRSVETLSDKNNRLIDVIVYSRNSMLIINISNPLYSALEFDGEFPKSTKPDTGYHGFGLKSIRYTAEKYDGFVTIDTNDNLFSLFVIIPIPDSGPQKETA